MCQYAVDDNGIRGVFVYAAISYAADSAGDHFDRGRAYLQSGRFSDTAYYGDDVAMMVSVPTTLLIAESIINWINEILFPIANSLIDYGEQIKSRSLPIL